MTTAYSTCFREGDLLIALILLPAFALLLALKDIVGKFLLLLALLLIHPNFAAIAAQGDSAD